MAAQSNPLPASPSSGSGGGWGGTQFYPLPDSPSGGSGGDWGGGERSLTTSLAPTPVEVGEAGGESEVLPHPCLPLR